MRLFFLFSIIFFTCCSSPEVNEQAKSNVEFIDPFMCTSDDRGQTDPSASIPFGMVKAGPDTRPVAHAGYEYTAEEMQGFSSTRFSGVGCRGTGGNLRVLPYNLTNNDTVPEAIKYKKQTEVAIPGYYSVTLDNGIKCELTATRQVAVHRYTYPESDKSGLSIDLASAFVEPKIEEHTINADGIITGKVSSGCVCKKGIYTFYFAISTDKEGIQPAERNSVLNYVFSTTANEELNVYCALSVVSEENARRNLNAVKDQSFDNVKNAAYTQWEELVKVVDVETDNDTLKRLFYTHLYHVVQSPFIINDNVGEYRGSDGKLYKTEQNYYHGWSIWDTFRSKLPLLSLFYPERFKEITTSLGELYKQGKPDWGTETEPFLTVRTEHSVIVLLEAYRKGLLTFSLEDIYPQLKEEATKLPFKTPDNILESSFDLWALSEIAKELGHDEDAERYHQKAFQYDSIWKEKFMVMDENSDIMHGDGLYEGTLWQYRWFVPFDIEGIQKLVGGKDEFERQLDYFFENELFNIGNQPDIQVPYLYAYTNAPWKTQKLVNTLLTKPTNNWYGTHKKWKKPEYRKIFQDSPEGYVKEMDDDAGTMSGWYVCSAIGLYPVFPGSTQLVVNTPLFHKVTINTTGGSPLVIEATNLSDKSIYIQSITFNGEELDSNFIDFNRISKGGKLEIVLGEQPVNQG